MQRNSAELDKAGEALARASKAAVTNEASAQYESARNTVLEAEGAALRDELVSVQAEVERLEPVGGPLTDVALGALGQTAAPSPSDSSAVCPRQSAEEKASTCEG